MKAKLSRSINRLILAIISLLGFTMVSCEPELMYGTPNDSYKSDYRAEFNEIDEEGDVAVPLTEQEFSDDE